MARFGKFRFLPGETSGARAREESAEAIVAMRPLQRAEERRAEGTDSSAPRSIVPEGKTRPNVSSARGRNPESCANPVRPRDAVATSRQGRETPPRTGAHEPRRDSKAGGNDGRGSPPV